MPQLNIPVMSRRFDDAHHQPALQQDLEAKNRQLRVGVRLARDVASMQLGVVYSTASFGKHRLAWSLIGVA
jgi:hypothetical protein